MRELDTVIEILSNLSTEDYQLTEKAAMEFYNFGNTKLLEYAAKKTSLTCQEILWMW